MNRLPIDSQRSALTGGGHEIEDRGTGPNALLMDQAGAWGHSMQAGLELNSQGDYQQLNRGDHVPSSEG
jgi:hypothetical protein